MRRVFVSRNARNGLWGRAAAHALPIIGRRSPFERIGYGRGAFLSDGVDVVGAGLEFDGPGEDAIRARAGALR